MLEGGNASTDVVLHFTVSGANILVLRGGSLLDVIFGVCAYTGSTEPNVALLYMVGDVPLQQKLEISSLGCKSQKVRLKSIIFD